MDIPLPFTLAQAGGDARPVPAVPVAPSANTTTTTVAPGTSGTPIPTSPNSGGAGSYLPFLLLAFVAVFLGMSMWNQRKEKKKRQALLDAVKKGDKIQTVGGIIGTVAEVREHEVLVKVDDNTRIRFARSAIQGVVENKNEA